MADNDNDLAEGSSTAPTRGQKILEAAVYIMGAMLIAGVFILIGGIVWKATRKGDAPPAEVKTLDLDLSAATVTSMDLDGDRLAIRAGSEILVIDTRKGAVIARIRLKP